MVQDEGHWSYNDTKYDLAKALVVLVAFLLATSESQKLEPTVSYRLHGPFVIAFVTFIFYMCV